MCLYMYEVLFLFPLQFFWFGLKMYPEKFEKEEIINICKECPDDIWHPGFLWFDISVWSIQHVWYGLQTPCRK